MNRYLSTKEIESVTKLEAHKRYKYFLNQVADWALVWGLYDSGWVMGSDENGSILFPVWPAKEYAQLCIQGRWATASPKSIETHEFMDVFLEDLKNRDIYVSVFYTPQEKGVFINPGELYKDLSQELSRIE